MKDLHVLANNIKSRKELANFVLELMHDLERGSNWGNSELDRYLEALAAWIKDMDGYYQNQGQEVPDKPEWKTFGDMLLAATIYE